MSVTVKLRTPIQAHGETLHELTLREPRGKDIASCGVPRSVVVRGKSTRIEVDTAVVYEYIVTLASIPPSSVDTISALDWDQLTNAVLGFFVPAGEGVAEAAGEAKTASGDEASNKVQMPFQELSTSAIS